MKLRQLVLGAYPEYPAPESLPELSVEEVECDSRKVQPGSLFIAVHGAKLDGNMYIHEAKRRGAVAIVSENGPGDASDLPFIQVPDGRDAVARLARVFYGHPSQNIQVAGITGTNGKTTVTYLVEYLMQSRKKIGVIGTVNYRYAGMEEPAVETTPGPLELQRIFSRMAASGCEAAVMEASSHALDQRRVLGIDFACAAFTNFTQDHLDYHGTLEKYFEAKSKLFTGLSKQASAVLNVDDEWVRKIVPRTHARVSGYAIDREAEFRAQNLVPRADSTQFELLHPGGRTPVFLPMIGRHNVYNALAALAVCEALGMPASQSAPRLGEFPGVPGRLESVRCGQNFTVLVDFAHTPDGLENVLSALAGHRRSRLQLVFGCGGDRDRLKRPKMAAVAAKWADFTYVTSDNPRSEDPKSITEEVRAGFPEGFKNYAVIVDRAKAIRQALLNAREGDVVLLAGKGHERSQIFADRTEPFSDRLEAEKVLNGR